MVETCKQNPKERMCFSFVTYTNLVFGDKGTDKPTQIFPLERSWQILLEKNPDSDGISPWLATGVRITNTVFGDMRPTTAEDLP